MVRPDAATELAKVREGGERVLWLGDGGCRRGRPIAYGRAWVDRQTEGGQEVVTPGIPG